MDEYNFWQDFFDTYQSLSDWLKFAWLVVPPAFLLGLVALFMWYRLATKRAAETGTGTLAYTVFSSQNDGLRIYTHNGADALNAERSEAALLPLPGTKPPALSKQPPRTAEDA
ncbi:MAG: hypothetical protein ACFB01_05710 [Cohaesibacteraceae bacterium]